MRWTREEEEKQTFKKEDIWCIVISVSKIRRIDMSEKIVLIDGHSILNRAFYGVPDLTNAEGLHTNAVYGFLNILFKILEERKTGVSDGHI